MKKAFAIIMLLALLAGCAKESAREIDGAAKGDALNVSVGFWNVQNMAALSEKDELWKYVEERFGLNITPVSVDWANYNEQYKIMASTGTLPDVFACVTISASDAATSGWYNNLIASGSIRALPDDMSAYPLLQDIMERAAFTRFSDGRAYMIPRTSLSGDTLAYSDAAMLVRRDWMENLGLSSPETIDDFIHMAAAFAKLDPDGNGIDDTIGYNVNNRAALGKWVMLGIAPECNVYGWLKTDDGFLPSYLTDSFADVIEVYRELYETGGLDPDFMIKKSNDSVADFARGKLGLLEYKSSPAALYEVAESWDIYHDESEPFGECVALLNVPRAPDGKYYSNSSMFFWSETLVSARVSDEKLDRILALYEFLLSEEGWRLTRCGMPGVDYAIDENGEYVYLPDVSGSTLASALSDKYPSLALFTSLASWGGTRMDFENSDFNRLRYGEDVMELTSSSLAWAEANTAFIERPYDFLMIVKEDSETFSTTSVQDDVARVIISSGDAREEWAQVVAGYYRAGIQSYIDRQNERARELGIE